MNPRTLRVGGPLVMMICLFVSLLLTGCQTGSNSFDDLSPIVDENADLSLRVRNELKRRPITSLLRIEVTTIGEDTVRLAGSVDTDTQSVEAERIAGQVSGVRSVMNALYVQR